LRKSHARPRVQQAPGLPCALYFEEGKRNANLGRSAPRERETISTSLRAQRSNPPLHLPRYGLLRSARNDAERAGFAPAPRRAREAAVSKGEVTTRAGRGLPTKRAANPSGQAIAFCDATKPSAWPLLTGNGNSVRFSVLVQLACKLRSRLVALCKNTREDSCAN
jgi:hypothetical protein